MRNFCTYFDAQFLPRALALHASLKQHCPESRLWTLCLDDAAYRAVSELHLAGVEPISLAELEAADPELAAARGNRARVEY